LSAVVNPAPRQALPDIIAAVDLGTNSFHLIVAAIHHGEIVVIDRLRETVRLGAGLDDNKQLVDETQGRALACLERFGQRLRRLPRGSVRAVGTNTLRLARNAREFLALAEEKLGHSIEIIAGREEARLIYLGVAHGLEAGTEKRLVVDIGGGSTEIISGCGFEPTHRESLHVGCVNLSVSRFANGHIKRKLMRAAELDAELAIQPVARMFRRTGWERVIGCSGTIRSIAAVAQGQGWCTHGIDRTALEKLREAMLEAGHIDKLVFPGLAEDRRPILPGGVAVLWAVFDLLEIQRMDVSDQALREGVLYDLIGRIHHSDVRHRTIQSLLTRWGVDIEHAERVRGTADFLLQQVAQAWQLEDETSKETLAWGALLHEVGLSISHNQYHKHGAYVVGNADLSGFSKPEQEIVAVLVRAHRRKMPDAAFSSLPKSARKPARYLCVLLRLAALLHRNRTDTDLSGLELTADGDTLKLKFPEGWLDKRALTVADLEQEVDYLKAAGIALTFG